jgi:hypothetical protein
MPDDLPTIEELRRARLERQADQFEAVLRGLERRLDTAEAELERRGLLLPAARPSLTIVDERGGDS